MTEASLEILPAATVILLRDHEQRLETLLLRRNSKLVFSAGMWVFPGGRIDEHELRGVNLETAARRAAVRETEEESGVQIKAEDLVPYSHWTTPPGQSRRFATWFFLARVPDSREIEVDGGEIEEHIWITPDQALADKHAGLKQLMAPTFVSLLELGDCANVDEVLQRAARRAPPVFEPHFCKTDDGPISLYYGDSGYETYDINAEGPRHRCEMCETGWAYINDGVQPW